MLVDESLEGGRVDVVAPVAGQAVDLYLVVHGGVDLEAYGRALVAGVQRLFPDAEPHVRARLYADTRQSAVAIVTPSGLAKWSRACAATPVVGADRADRALRAHFQTLLLDAYRGTARRHAPAVEGDRPGADGAATLTHETCFPDGSVHCWSG